MVKIRISIVLLASLLLASAVARAATPSSPAQTFDLEGFFMPEGTWLKDFKNVDHLYLNGKTPEKIGGWLQLRNRTRFKVVGASLRGMDFDFKTARSGGVHYEFSGAFVRLENFSRTQPQGRVLKGTLKKYRGGKRLAESPVSFTYFVGD